MSTKTAEKNEMERAGHPIPWWAKLLLFAVIAAGAMLLIYRGVSASHAERQARMEAARAERRARAAEERRQREAEAAQQAAEASAAEEAVEEEAGASEEADSPSAEELAGMLPYRGMDEGLIGLTFLGEPDEVKEGVTFNYKENVNGRSRNTRTTGTAYHWLSRNGKDELVFSAYCSGGVVRKVSRWGTLTTYWPDGSGLPDLHADGSAASPSGAASEENPPDPLDYDSVGEYIDDASPWFSEHGYSDPDGAAEDYWDQHGPW